METPQDNRNIALLSTVAVIFSIILFLLGGNILVASSVGQKYGGGRISVSAGKKHILEYWFEKGKKIRWYWEIENPDTGIFPDKIEFYIRAPNGQVVYQVTKRADVSFTERDFFTTKEPGVYSFIWKNKNWFESVIIKFKIEKVEAVPKLQPKAFPLVFDILRFSVVGVVAAVFFFPLLYLLRRTHILLKRGKIHLYSQVKWGPLDILWLILFSVVAFILLFIVVQKVNPSADLLFINLVSEIFSLFFVFVIVLAHGDSFSNLGFRSFSLKEIALVAPTLLIPLFIFEWVYEGICTHFVGKEVSFYHSGFIMELLQKEPLVGVFFVFLVGPICEEVVFRGFLHQALRKRLKILPGILLSSAIFSFAHLNPLAFIPILLVGIVLAYVFERTHSLVPCIAIHVLNNGVALLPFLVPELKIF